MMGWRSCVLVLTVCALSGIVGQELDHGDATVLSEGLNNLGNINIPTEEPEQFKTWKENCRKNVGDEAVKAIEETQTTVMECINDIIKWDKLQHEINVSIPRGELDLVFKKYCKRRDRLMACVEDVLDRLDKCLDDIQRRDMNVTRKAIDTGIDFICHNDGDRIALFMAEDGGDCVKSQQDNIKQCIEEKVPEFKEYETGKDEFDIKKLTINEENCKTVNAMHQCVVTHTEKCDDPTPANILDSLITQMLKVTTCWQKSSAPTLLPYTQNLLPHLLTIVAAALTAANILL